MSSRGERGKRSNKTADDGVGSSFSTFYVDPKAVTEFDAASRCTSHSLSGIQFAPTESDAVPCPLDLREDRTSSSLCTELQRLEISPPSRPENHQTLVRQPEASPQRPATVQIQWRPDREQEEPEFFDVAMIYCQEDKELVNKFADVLQRFIILDGQQKLRIYTDFFDLRDAFGGQELDHFDHVLRCSSYAFVFFSRKSVNSKDLRGKCDRTMALHGSITDESCAKVIPVVTEPNLPLGCCFSAYTKINLRSLLLGDRIFDLVDVDDLELKHLDKRLLDRIAKVLNESRAKRRDKLMNCGISNIDRSAAANWPTTQTVSHMELIQTNYNALVDSMDVEFGLLSYLFSKCILSHREMESVQAESTRYKKNEKLLNILYLKDAKSFETFVCGLSETNQDNLAQLLHDRAQKLSVH